MRPMTGTETGRLLSSSAPPRTLPRVPSITLGVKPRRPLPLPAAESSGNLITSIARARLGRRRMKPRSSSAVIRRWLQDFERRSSPSFISSKEGGTPDSFRRSLMNRRSSYCLRVSISSVPQFAVFKSRYVPFDSSRLIRKVAPESQMTLICRHQESKTNHEQTLYFPYVFRNHLISRQRDSFCRNRALAGSVRKPQDLASRAGGGLWRK